MTRKRGTGRMRELGLKAVTIWLSAGEERQLYELARRNETAVATMARSLVLEGVVRETVPVIPPGFILCRECPLRCLKAAE